MESVRFHDSKLKLLKALLFRSFHETEAPTAGFCSVFICGRAYPFKIRVTYMADCQVISYQLEYQNNCLLKGSALCLRT